MSYRPIQRCRVCKSKDLDPLFSLGNFYISTFVENPDDNIGKCPLSLAYCNNCTLVQLEHTPSQELLYSGNYWYRSGLNKVIRDDLREIAKRAIKMVKLKYGDGFLDIGANDGTLLSFVPKKYLRVAIEPANNLQRYLKQHCDYVEKAMWEDVDLGITFKIITAIGMFYDSKDPNRFISNVKEHLDEDGLFIAQLMTSKSMLEKNDLGNICHEHIEYYSYKSLKTLFERNGLEIFKVEENGINGGSYRLFARHYKNGSIKYSEKINKRSYSKFYDRILKNKERFLEFLTREVARGKKIYGYGASTKGNTILQFYGLPNLIKGIAEIHKDKIGKYTVGTKIKIISEEEALKNADYLWILPYGFKDFFIKKHRNWLKRGGKFVLSIPRFEIIGYKKD